MIRALLRLQPGWPRPLLMLLGGVCLVCVLALAYTRPNLYDIFFLLPFVLFSGRGGEGLLAIFGGARYDSFTLALPVRGRALLAARLLASALYAVPFGAMGLSYLLKIHAPVQRSAGKISTDHEMAMLYVSLAALYFLGVALSHCIDVASDRLSRRQRRWTLLAIAAAAVGLWVFRSQPLFLVALVAVALGLIVRALIVVPPSLRIRIETARADSRPVADTRPSGRAALREWLGRTSLVIWRVIFLLLPFSFFAWFSSWVPFALAFAVPMGWLMATHTSSGAGALLRGTAALPLSRRALFPYVALPGLLALLLGLAVTRSSVLPTPAIAEPSSEMQYMHYAIGGSGPGFTEHTGSLSVPPELFRIGWGQPDAVRAPTGETLTPTARRIIPGLPLYGWNPYEVRGCSGDPCKVGESSPEFAAFQMGRALKDGHGPVIAPERLLDLARGVNFNCSLAVRQNVEPATTALVLGFVWFLPSLIALRRKRPSRSLSGWMRRRVLWWTGIGALVLLGLGTMTPLLALAAALVPAQLVAAVGRALPRDPVGAWSVVVLLAGCCYAILERRFARMEASGVFLALPRAGA
jgi:hypothetical protein